MLRINSTIVLYTQALAQRINNTAERITILGSLAIVEGSILGLAEGAAAAARNHDLSVSDFNTLFEASVNPSAQTTQPPLPSSRSKTSTTTLVAAIVSGLLVLVMVMLVAARVRTQRGRATSRHDAQEAISMAIKASQATFRSSYPRLQLSPMEHIPL